MTQPFRDNSHSLPVLSPRTATGTLRNWGERTLHNSVHQCPLNAQGETLVASSDRARQLAWPRARGTWHPLTTAFLPVSVKELTEGTWRHVSRSLRNSPGAAQPRRCSPRAKQQPEPPHLCPPNHPPQGPPGQTGVQRLQSPWVLEVSGLCRELSGVARGICLCNRRHPTSPQIP